MNYMSVEIFRRAFNSLRWVVMKNAGTPATTIADRRGFGLWHIGCMQWVRELRPAARSRSSFDAMAPVGRWLLPKTPRLAGCGATSPLLFSTLYTYLPESASRLTMGTNVLKSNGLGTCRSNPASMAASISLLEA